MIRRPNKMEEFSQQQHLVWKGLTRLFPEKIQESRLLAQFVGVPGHAASRRDTGPAMGRPVGIAPPTPMSATNG